MQKPQDLIRIRHVPYPGVPGAVHQASAKAGQHEHDD